MTSDKRQYIYYMMDFISSDNKWYEKMRDTLYSGKDYSEAILHDGVSLHCKEKPMTLANFIRDRKINLIIN